MIANEASTSFDFSPSKDVPCDSNVPFRQRLRTCDAAAFAPF